MANQRLIKQKKNRTWKKPRDAPPANPSQLLLEANTHLETGQPSLAYKAASQALFILQKQPSPEYPFTTLPALNILGEICLDLGDPTRATKYFQQAVEVDKDGLASEVEGGGAEKYLWLAQLCEEGGEKSVQWFQKGVDSLRKIIEELGAELQSIPTNETDPIQAQRWTDTIEEKKQKAAGALCGIVEVYMTDLSWDPFAESHCEENITAALSFAPTSPSVLQTLASIRLSQSNLPAARSALTSSLSLWTSLPPSHPQYPDFPTRISLSRLLMESEMEDEAMEVLERLVSEDDESVEAWYLGGWCLWLVAEKTTGEGEGGERRAVRRESRSWLGTCLELYRKLEYEDERLEEHARELVEGLDKELGGAEDEDEDEDEAEDVDGEGDEEEDESADVVDEADETEEKPSTGTDIDKSESPTHDHPMSGI